MAKTLSGFKVIGDTSKIGAGSKKGSAGQTSPTPSSNGSSRTLGGFKVIGDTSKIGAKAAAKTTQQTGAQSATLTQSTTRYPQPMDNVGRQTGTNSRLLADTKQSGTLIPSLDNGRVGKVISGAAKSVGSAYTNLGGVLAEGAGKLNTRIANQNAGDSLQSDHDAVKRYEKMLRDVKWANGRAMSAKDVKQVQGYLASAKRRIASHEGYTKAVEQSDKAVADKAYQKADRLSQSSAADVAQAKEGLGPVGQFAVDLGVQGVQMAGDVAASTVIPGAGLALMTARSAGSSAQQARQAGATYGQQLAYGLGSGALSLGTEKISNVSKLFQKTFGRGLAEKAASKLIAKFGESTAVQVMSNLAKRPAGRLALSMISEGGEEFLEDYAQPFLQRATYDPSARFDLSEALYDAAVGAAMGGIGGALDVVRGHSNAPTPPQEAAGAQTDVREGSYAPVEQVSAEGAQNAASGVETAENIRVGQATTIKKPYKGEVPTQTQRQNTAPVQVSSEALTRAQNSIAGARGLESSLPGQSFKSTLKNVYKSIFKSATGVVVDGTSFGGQPYAVDIPNSVPGKVISDTNLTAEKLALLDNLPDVVRNGTYVGSGEYVPHGAKAKKTVRFDYFEAPVEINGKQYIASFDVEAFPDVNNYRTHKLNEIELSPMTNADTGRDPAANAMRTVPVEGTRPLNANDSIAQGAENVKNGGSRDILSEVLFGKKRADLNTMTEAQQDAIFRANEEGTVGMDATGKVFQIDPEQHIDRRRMETVGGRDVNAFQFDHPEMHRYYQEAANALIADADLSLQQPMSRRYERTMEGNAVQQAAQTSPHLRQAMDETRLPRDAIIDAAQRIITDQGQENVAAAKRVELILDDMLSNGYTTMTGEQVGPNSGYLTAKQGILGAGETQARGHELDGIDGFDGLGNADAGTLNTDFDRMQARSEEFHPVNPNSAERVQNDQRRAPSEVPVVNPDTGRNVEKTVSTILNSPLTSPEMATVYENAIAGGAFDYDVVTDRSAVQQAQAKIARDGWREVANSFIAKAELGQRITKADTAEAISAYNLAISEGDHKAAFELATAISEAAHDSAQVTQAMNLMNRLTPEGRLLTLRRLVDKMNDRAARQNRTPRQSITDSGGVEGARVDYIDKVTGFTLSDELATNYLMAETDAERAAAWDAITTSIADQIPSTFREKANFWRYTSMLTNPTTHIRNIMGNAIQMGARKIKNGIGTAIERAVIKDPSQRTKAVNVDKDLKSFAKGQYETDQSAAMGSGKYSDATAAGIEREIQSKRKMFKGEDVLSRSIQWIGEKNSELLDREDVRFNKSAYVDSFAQALQAKGVTAAEAHAGTRAADVEAARAYAIEEAQRATYRNTTALSEALSKRGRYDASDNIVERGLSFVTDALLPFRKTPANILTTGLDYSPVGLGKGIWEALFDVKSGKCTAADAVDSIASGLTGTGILALGAYLAAEGFFGATLHVRAGDDDKEEAFEKSMGGQDYAIQIGDKSYTLDWMTPAAMPLFAGAAIMESVQKGGGTFVSLVDATKNIGSVIWETSMLSALNDLISYWSYADDPGAYLISKAASSYAGQYIPTIGSKVASVFDDTVRKSYVEKGSGQVASDVNYFLQGAAKKVPGARNQLQPMVDMWGNEVSNGSAPERVFQSFFSPGFLKAQDNSPATQEIRRLAKATGDSAVYPAAADKSYTVKGETRTLTGEEYTRYAKTMGQTRKELVEAAVKLPAYKSMSNAEKADYIQNIYKYARETARQQVDPKYEPSAAWIKNAQTSKRDIGVSTGEFLALYQKYGSGKMSGAAYEKVKQAHDSGLSPKEYFSLKDRADADGNGRVSKAEASAALAGQEHRADLWDIICTTNAKNPYK
jgi:hypothetical protein